MYLYLRGQLSLDWSSVRGEYLRGIAGERYILQREHSSGGRYGVYECGGLRSYAMHVHV
jgi:hypothetical protein